jgi:large subunit ribosomal protein L31e
LVIFHPLLNEMAVPTKESSTKRPRSSVPDLITREYTIHLHKHVHGRQFKKRAPSAVKAIRAFAVKAMSTSDVRIDPRLNKAVWGKGIRNVPRRVRVRLQRLRNDEEDAKEKLYTLVSFIPIKDFKGLQTEVISD